MKIKFVRPWWLINCCLKAKGKKFLLARRLNVSYRRCPWYEKYKFIIVSNRSTFNKADLAFHFLQTLPINIGKYRDWLTDWCLTLKIAIFQLYLGVGKMSFCHTTYFKLNTKETSSLSLSSDKK